MSQFLDVYKMAMCGYRCSSLCMVKFLVAVFKYFIRLSRLVRRVKYKQMSEQGIRHGLTTCTVPIVSDCVNRRVDLASPFYNTSQLT